MQGNNYEIFVPPALTLNPGPAENFSGLVHTVPMSQWQAMWHWCLDCFSWGRLNVMLVLKPLQSRKLMY